MSVRKRLQERLILLKIRHGDAGAYAEVYDEMVDPLFRFISFRVQTVEIAQDLTSEVFLKVWERVNGGDSIENLRAYFYKVARNLIADHYRKSQAVLWNDGEVEDIEDESHATIERQVTLAEIEVGVKKLRPDWQEVIILTYIEGLSLKEVAGIVGKSYNATRVILHRALNELKRLLK